jgi:hypothetical protein
MLKDTLSASSPVLNFEIWSIKPPGRSLSDGIACLYNFFNLGIDGITIGGL